MTIGSDAAAMAEDDDVDFKPEVVPKSKQEVERIRTAVRANFLFQHLNERQQSMVFDVMQRVPVSAGETVIQQGDPGDWFYVVDSGEYIVTIKQDGKEVEILRYTTAGGTNPCFGELALMYSKPRAATVKAAKDGVLWAMDRRSFRNILMKSTGRSIMKTLRSVDVLKSLSVGQLQRLCDVLTEVTYDDGEYVIKQGETSDTFYIIVEGKAVCTKRNDPANMSEKPQHLMELGEGQYFGERALLFNNARAANVVAQTLKGKAQDGKEHATKLKCLYISKDAFEEVLGPLQAIIDEDRKWREKVAEAQRNREDKEKLSNCKLGDFAVQGGALVSAATFQLHLVKNASTGAEYTLKSLSKQAVVDKKQTQRVAAEKALLASFDEGSTHVPLAVTSFDSGPYLHLLFKTRATCELSELMEDGKIAEGAAKFYVACVASGLAELHAKNVAYRNVSLDALTVDERGYVVLMDFCFAEKL
jgi:CRP-like cAMP-binding protein